VTYLGKLRDGEQIYPGQHVGIIDAELWERANAAVERWRASVRGEHPNSSRSSTVERQAGVAGPPPVPRIRRLMALALQMEQMMEEGTVKNYSELAHLGRVSTARITQVMNLLHLAPDIQEEILLRKQPHDWLREPTVRKLSSIALWSKQRKYWQGLIAAASLQELDLAASRSKAATQR